MNDAPTPAKTTAFDAPFARGATATIDGNTKHKGGDPETIAQRKQSKSMGTTREPLFNGNQRKFQDGPENHPDIPLSSMSSVTQNTPKGISTRASGTWLQKQPTAKNPMGKK